MRAERAKLSRSASVAKAMNYMVSEIRRGPRQPCRHGQWGIATGQPGTSQPDLEKSALSSDSRRRRQVWSGRDVPILGTVKPLKFCSESYAEW